MERNQFNELTPNERILFLRCLLPFPSFSLLSSSLLPKIEGDARDDLSPISGQDSIGFWTAVIRLSLYNHWRVGEADTFPRKEAND